MIAADVPILSICFPCLVDIAGRIIVFHIVVIIRPFGDDSPYSLSFHERQGLWAAVGPDFMAMLGGLARFNRPFDGDIMGYEVDITNYRYQ